MLSIRNIVKQYANHRALDDVSIEIEHGKIFGLLGPNGAGKTSLIRIINQITAPDAGEILINGEKLNPSHIAQIGYLPEERGLYKKMEIGEQMLYLAQLKGMRKEEAIKKIKFWFEKMEMQTWWNKKVEDLSKGMQQKVQFVATVVHEPELIILDEPFSGFDPVNAEIIKNEILALRDAGTTVVLSTHRMESVDLLCDYIAMIHKSHKVIDGPVQDIKRKARPNVFSVKMINNNQIVLPEWKDLKYEQEYLSFCVSLNGTLPNDVLRELMQHGEILGFEEVIPSIEEIFIQKVKDSDHE